MLQTNLATAFGLSSQKLYVGNVANQTYPSLLPMPQFFHRANCQGKTFRNQSLVRADFSNADIRGVDFTQAMLLGANFSGARAGMSTIWSVGFVLLILLMAVLAGLTSGYAGAFVGDLVMANSIGHSVFGGFSLAILFSYGFILIRQGLGATLVILIEVVVAFLVAALAFFPNNEMGLVQGANFSLLALGGILAGLGNMAVAIALAGLMLLPKPNLWVVSLAVFGMLLGVLFGVSVSVLSYPLAAFIGLANILLGLSVGRKALAEDANFSLVRKAGIVLLTQKGTCFRGADLTDANFSQAILLDTDLRDANLTRTNWFQSKYLNQAHIDEGTYLENVRVRQLLLDHEGAKQSFDGLNLQGLNLQGSNLQGASFLGSNLTESNLRGANLIGAKLAQAQLYKTDLRETVLTGAYIQNWGIAKDTKFEEIICDYVYMRLPTVEDPDPCRKPDDKHETFSSGDFATFIAPIIRTLDLYQQQNVDPRRIAENYKTVDLFHRDGLDPSAAAIALKQLAEQYPEAGLEIIALEGHGDEKIRLQARVRGKADQSQLSAEYFEKYHKATALPYGDLQSLLTAISEKDQRIQSLENMVTTAMKSDKFYVETYYDLGKSDEEQVPVKKILILTSNPQNIDRRRLDAEVREIQTGLERAKKRDQFEIIAKWAVRTEDLRRALLDYEPQIVHFSGYGAANEGLALENETGEIKLVSTVALASLFEVFKGSVECVFLNACYSAEQTDAISQHIPYVIGMNHEIGDRAAMEFAVGFYDALGAGRSISDAFKLGCISIDLEGLPESLTPVLKKK